MRLAVLALVIGAAASAACAADFFPLRTGNTWTYREAASGGSFTVTVGNPVLMKNQVYYSLQGYGIETLLARINERNDLVRVDEQTGAEQLLTSFNPSDASWWEAPARGCRQEGQTLQQRGVHDGAAGPVKDVLQMNYRVYSCADFGVVSEQYAENLGLVRRVVTTIAGPRQYDLVYARVGSMVIDAAPNAGFTISVLDAGTSKDATVTLRLETNPPGSLKLQFPSSQEYDVALLDENGSTLWTWSADKAFLQALHELVISGRWSASVSIPSQLLRPAGGQAATYTIRAWLTTAGPNSGFAATAPVTVPAANTARRRPRGEQKTVIQE